MTRGGSLPALSWRPRTQLKRQMEGRSYRQQAKDARIFTDPANGVREDSTDQAAPQLVSDVFTLSSRVLGFQNLKMCLTVIDSVCNTGQTQYR